MSRDMSNFAKNIFKFLNIMKRAFLFLFSLLTAVSFSFARTFDGTAKIYLKANAVSWWTDANAVQRAVLENTTAVIGTVEDAERKIYAFTIPEGDYTTIRFERCETAESGAWNKTGEITIPAVGDYVSVFAENSSTATWTTYVPAGELVYHTYHIYVTNNTGWDVCYLYEWGTPNEITGKWPGATGTDFTYQVAEGEKVELNLLFHNNVGQDQPGDKRITIVLTEARDYNITIPEPVSPVTSAIKVLSINNSLIDYNDQYAMFNSMSETMNKDATWTKHTNLGKTLAYHFNEDPLTPDAKTMVASVAWTHIILQEQSSLPRTDLSAFYSNVSTWVTYIRANCPNENVKIILPINWAYSDDESFAANNATLIANYKAVADDFNLMLCPVALAYGNYRLDHPSTFVADLYTDNRHPTPAASYLACCLEYATIFGENPSTITWKPDGLAAEMAERMRTYAQEAYEGTERTEPAPQPTTEALSITGAILHSENFNSIGGDDVNPTPASDGKTAVEQASTLPQGWRIENNTTAARTLGSFSGASATTRYIGGTSLASNDKNGTWNFGATGSTDRAVGGITSSVSGGARTLNLMVHLHNDANTDFNTLALSYDVEKYRNGANDAGFTVQLYVSADGEAWTSAGIDFCTSFSKDDDSNGAAVVPIATTSVNGNLECVFPEDGDLYLAWSISVTSGTDLAKSMALAIDNVALTPSYNQTIPDYAVVLTNTNTILQDFDCLGGTDADPSTDSKTGIAQASTLPTGWKIERNLNGPRQLGTFAGASETTMYIGGQSLATNAYNGTWNFGATGSSDRAVGGLTTGVDGGTRGINVMARLYNNSASDFKSIALEYDIEKYRNGSNSAGFTVQLYTSADGTTWTSAGDDFKTSFAADANNNGYATVPAATTHVSKNLSVALDKNTSLYLAWNISVSSGTTCNAAPGLAIDNVSITPSTSVLPTDMVTIPGQPEIRKVLRNGMLLIEHNGKYFNALGQPTR